MYASHYKKRTWEAIPMKKNNVIHFKNFMDGSFRDEPTKTQKIVIHFKKNKKVYIRIGLITTTLCLTALHPAFAATTEIDKKGYEIYKQLLSIGKWVIIVKGGWDVVRSTLSNDYDKAKKGFISYLLAYIFLLVMPALMGYADGIVGGLSWKG
jgi:hypothetical protein